MSKTEIIAQAYGILGLIIIVSSFQFKENKKFFTLQGVGSVLFFLNFIMIGAVAGALFNLTNFIRGMLFSKNTHKLWKLIVVEVLYTICFVFAVFTGGTDYFQIFIAFLPYAALVAMSVCMWNGNGKNIRISQITYMSPAWIIHNIFNFSLGGLICETINMISSFVALTRYKKNGFNSN